MNPAIRTRARSRCRSAFLLSSALLAWSLFGTSALSAQRVRVGSSSPSGIVGGILEQDVIFAAGDAKSGVELWRHTATKTELILDVYKGNGSSYPGQIVRRGVLSGRFWFVAREKGFGRELHHYPRLSGASTTRVVDIRTGTLGSHPRDLTIVGSTLFFTANDGLRGRELWSSDGTVQGTSLLADIRPGTEGSNPFGLTEFKGKLYFAATVPGTGTELYVSDGTRAGTILLSDIHPGAPSSTPSQLTVLGDRLYFAATRPQEGRELWWSDGSARGTTLSADIEPGVRSSSPDQLTPGLQLAFTASQAPAGRELFLTSPLSTPTRVSDLAMGESISQITPSGFHFWFRARTATEGMELWRTNNAGKVELAHDMRPGAPSSRPTNLVPFGTGMMFRANDGTVGQELWKTDGVTASLIRDIRRGPDHGRPSCPVPIGFFPTHYVFAAKQAGAGVEFYRFDGQSAGQVIDIDPDTTTPEMHLDGDDKFLNVEINDAPPFKPAALIVGLNATTPTRFPFLRGALIVNLALPNIPVLFSTNAAGQSRLGFNLPAGGLGGNPLAFQSFVETSASTMDATTPSSCTNGENGTPTSNGARARGVVCVDDETGEYQISAERLDANPTTAFIGVFRLTNEPTERELLFSFPLDPGQTVERDGRLEFKLRLLGEDANGDVLDMHIFDSEPTPDDATPSSYIVASYC